MCRAPLEVADCIRQALFGIGPQRHQGKKQEYESNFLLDLDYDSNEDEERQIILNNKAQPVSRLQSKRPKGTGLLDSDSEEHPEDRTEEVGVSIADQKTTEG